MIQLHHSKMHRITLFISMLKILRIFLLQYFSVMLFILLMILLEKLFKECINVI